MHNVKVNKYDLLEIAKNNRAKHREVVDKAIEGYRKAVIDALESRLEAARRGQLPDMYIRLVQPVDQTREYDRAIGMLEMSTEPVVEISAETYANLVRDEWDWSDQFRTSNSTYTKVD